MPLNNVWYNDWVYDKDPILETGTPVLDNSGKPKDDAHFSSLAKDGKTPVIREIFENGKKVKSEWIVLESWVDWAEGSTWYRSDHPEYLYPNQYISLVREFADEESQCILLEAEAVTIIMIKLRETRAALIGMNGITVKNPIWISIVLCTIS